MTRSRFQAPRILASFADAARALFQIQTDLDAATRSDYAQQIRTSDFGALSPSYNRVNPGPSGIKVTMPTPAAQNAGEKIRFNIEDPRGSLTIFAVPGAKVNGNDSLILTAAGIIEFTSNGVDSWNSQAQLPGPVGPVGPGLPLPGTQSAFPVFGDPPQPEGDTVIVMGSNANRIPAVFVVTVAGALGAYVLPAGVQTSDTIRLVLTADTTITALRMFGGVEPPEGLELNLCLSDQSGGVAPGWSFTIVDNSGLVGEFRTPGQVQGVNPGPSYVMQSEEEGARLAYQTQAWRIMGGTAGQAITGAVEVAAGNGSTRASLFGTLASGAGLTGGGTAVLNVIGSTSIIVGANDVQRAAITGDVTAAQNVNVTVLSEQAINRVLTRVPHVPVAEGPGDSLGIGGGGPEFTAFVTTAAAAPAVVADGDYGDVQVVSTGTDWQVNKIGKTQSVTWAAQQDDFARIDTRTVNLRITLTGDQTLTGVTGGSSGSLLIVNNVDGADSLTILHQSTSVAGNQFRLTNSLSLVLGPTESAAFRYDGSDNKWRLFALAQRPPGRLIRTTIYSSGSGTHTYLAEARSVRVRMWGGGAQGGGCAATALTTQVSSAPGGGGGAYCEVGIGPAFSSITNPGASSAYAVGVGGSGGAAGAAGGDGGDTTFVTPATTVTAAGGLGGPGINNAASVAQVIPGGQGGTPATVTVGTVLLSHGGEQGGSSLKLALGVGASGNGGGCGFTGGSNTALSTGNGGSGQGHGCGGSGGYNALGAAVAAKSGGNGLVGRIIVEEYS